jgi:hypothetical protein
VVSLQRSHAVCRRSQTKKGNPRFFEARRVVTASDNAIVADAAEAATVKIVYCRMPTIRVTLKEFCDKGVGMGGER